MKLPKLTKKDYVDMLPQEFTKSNKDKNVYNVLDSDDNHRDLNNNIDTTTIDTTERK